MQFRYRPLTRTGFVPLFQVVDGNRDSQLSIRELRTAWERIKPYCKDRKGLATSDLPRFLQIS